MLPSCFIAMPMFTSLRQAVAHGDRQYFQHVLKCLVEPAVRKAGFQPWPPQAAAATLVHAEFARALRVADLVVADLSGRNPNVFFELGIRTGRDLPVSLICDNRTELPFDVRIWNCYRYRLARKAWAVQREVDALAEHIADSATRAEGRNEFWKHFGDGCYPAELREVA
jgi:hypothetical protein